MAVRLVVVGGGLAGLSAAYAAERAAREAGLDLRVALLEASTRLGGKVQTAHSDRFVLEGGPDAVVRYKPWALELMRELGLEERITGTQPAKPAAFIYLRGKAHPIPEGLNVVVPSRLGPLLRTPLVSLPGKLRAARDLWMRRAPRGDEPFGAFITRRLGREVWENLAAPLVGGIYGGDPYQLSTLAAFPQLKALEDKYGSLIRGSLAMMRQRKASREGGSLFASLKGGLGELVTALRNALEKTDLALGVRVTRLERTGTVWRVYVEGGVLEADAVVFAAPAFAAAKALAEVAPRAAEALRGIPYGDAATVSFAFPADQFPATQGHGILAAAREGLAVRGFTWVDRKWNDRAPEGYRLVRAYLSGEAARQSEEELARAALADLRKVVGRSVNPERTWVFRWPRGMPQYTVGHLERVQEIEAALSELPGLYLAGAAYRGVGLPEVIRDGRAAGVSAVTYLTGKTHSSAR
ncbi:protoporphyrinogen oxidase [Marinithermus hydrothermalis]|uniref:Coproporphyrinogen III oxidase n=1 Tax=Marinithermus hydrothermalis (strain DSM 14884 / JCM 11576 / T1) TaxID=869210 RepID=F2NP81_MARHT|nr:protoporphyrinogen oxidase [Marinithermus hydrothermalis]AEB11882.1 protoporphyrinogen oxidase [Marinithermus hydrothermalis DSM 14884]